MQYQYRDLRHPYLVLSLEIHWLAIPVVLFCTVAYAHLPPPPANQWTLKTVQRRLRILGSRHRGVHGNARSFIVGVTKDTCGSSRRIYGASWLRGEDFFTNRSNNCVQKRFSVSFFATIPAASALHTI
ncbi:hypothetical protein EJ02DRAFT_95383 [Clathrospora elynae]|uniref:Uncharacterized protein n=1 Tax=Clathrospora elynae TaxID=706981 RepID=A0A6A5T665_9PLEO|nr:hypothetical protein EJ02DRAFT_95383 [Clathrospora elynae]